MKKILVITILSAIFSSGCALNVSHLKPDIPRLHVIDRVPAKVAILIPESTRSLMTAEELPSGCIGTVNIGVSLGEAFEQTVEGVFQQVFERALIIDRLPAPDGTDVIFEASLDKVAYRMCCPISPGCYSDAGGNFSIIDNSGRELWNSRTRNARGTEVPILGGMSMAQVGEQVGALFTSAFAKLATEWSLDVKDSPNLQQYVYRAQAAPSTQTYRNSVEQKAAPLVSLSDIDLDIPETSNSNKDAIAVVIGNGNYSDKDIPSVDFAPNDAETVRKYLVNVLGYRDGNIIFEKDATKATFEMTFGTERDYRGKLYNYLKKGKSDIFIYYSGHGAPDLNTNSGYFVPSDANTQAIGLTGYPLEQFYNNIAKISKEMNTPNVFVVIDACFSGASEKGLILKNVSPITVKVKTPLVNLENAVVMTSSSGTEVSSWYPEKSHSMFTYFFLQGLKEMVKKGKSAISASDVYKYISDETEGLPYYARRLHGRIQTPQIMGDSTRLMTGK